MSSNTLRVRARGMALVENVDAIGASQRRFIGRKWQQVDGRWACVPVDGDVEVRDCAEYRMAILDGSLWAADQATADAVGVVFDETFGVSQ